MANTFKSYTRSSVSNSLTDLYTVPSGTTTIVIGVALANRIGAGTVVYADILIDKSSGDDVYMIRNAALYDGSSFTIADTGKIILNTGDKVRAISNTPNSVDVILSVLEQT